MTHEKQILALTCLLLVLPIVVTAECPSKEDIAPCTCGEPLPVFGFYIYCSKIDGEELARVASRLSGRKVWMVTVEDSELGSIPHDVFKGIELRYLAIRNSTLLALTDGSEALVGLEDQLVDLQIRDCVIKNKWDWSVLRNLKNLSTLEIYGSLQLETIGEDLMKSSLSNVKSFSFGFNNMSFVSDHAFDSFKDIGTLAIFSNKIKNVKRTMLPNPALKLSFINLIDNLIEQFPEDMFTNMPNLQNLNIDGNKILFLDQKIFSPVWEQLLLLTVDANPLRCDCRISWILAKRSPNVLFGRCASPPELKGKQLAELQFEDLVCHV